MSEQVPMEREGNVADYSLATRALERFTTLIDLALGNFLLYTMVTVWSSFPLWMRIFAVVVTPLLLFIIGLHYHALYDWARGACERRQEPTSS